MSKTNPARGMRDFLPADVRKREYVIGIIKEVYESYGFEPLETPAVENLETLTGKYGEEGNQLIYKILKRGEKLRLETGDGRQELKESDLSDLALRYDLTVPLARVVANNRNELPKFFKRYQIQPVWRADRPAKGRYREFYQCDVDAIGSSSILVEAELISAVSEILKKLGFHDFVIRLNHRAILTGLLNVFGIESDKHSEALIALDKLDKIGRDGVAKEFQERGIDVESAPRLLFLMDFFSDETSIPSMTNTEKIGIARILSYGQNLTSPDGMLRLDSDLLQQIVRDNSRSLRSAKDARIVLSNIRALLGLTDLFRTDDEGQKGLAELRSIWDHTNALGLADYIMIDPSLARGLSYYTGTIMEINVPDLAGSLGGGGRYDGLIGMFGKEQIPACGFSLGLERILIVMDERAMFPPEIAESTPADIMVTIWSEESFSESLKFANELRSQGLRVTLYPEPDKLGKQIKYADSIKVPYVCVLGESELADGKVTLKNMRSGDQQTLERNAVAKALKK